MLNKNKKKEQQDEGQEVKKKKFILNPVGWPDRAVDTTKRYFWYRPSEGFTAQTTGIVNIGHIFKIKSFKELLKTYTSTESENQDYEKAIEVEGLHELTLEKAHNNFQRAMFCLFVFIFAGSLYLLNLYLSTSGVSWFTFIPSICVIWVLTLLYLMLAWRAFRIRHRTLISHYKFMKEAIKYPSELLFIHDYDVEPPKKKKEKTQLVRKKK